MLNWLPISTLLIGLTAFTRQKTCNPPFSFCKAIVIPKPYYEYSNLACDCRDCNANPFYACTRGPLNGDQKNKPNGGCPYGQCKPCKRIGEMCKNSAECCDGFDSANDPANAHGFCKKESGKCILCALRREICGPGVPCCDSLSNPKSDVQCREIEGEIYKCLDHDCSGLTELSGYKCPGISTDFPFCKCGNSEKGLKQKQYHQCRNGGCRRCILPGQSCKEGDVCCQFHPIVTGLSTRTIHRCVNGTCQECFDLLISSEKKAKNCLTHPEIPCCPDPDEDDPLPVKCELNSKNQVSCQYA